jgi:hypothetical protein
VTTFNETYFDFDDAVEDLEEQIEEIDDAIGDLDDDDDSGAREYLTAQKQDLVSQKKGAIWARDHAYASDDFPQWDEDVDGVTLGALRAGAFGGLQDDIESDPNAGGGTSTNLLVAEGTVDAPYVDDSMSEAQRAGAVAQLHPYFRTWADARVNELMDPEQGNGTSSATSSAETPAETTSTGG